MKHSVSEMIYRAIAVWVVTCLIGIVSYYIGETIGSWFSPYVNSLLIGLGFIAATAVVYVSAEYIASGTKESK
jgi:energy-coupling factor transporter transmembrane protein EcfT